MPTDQHHILLLIEDDADQREPLTALLEHLGYDVAAAASGAAALDVLASGLRPSLIVLDMMMSDMDGLEFLRRHRRSEVDAGRTVHTPVILYSGGIALDAHARACGAVAAVQKPDLDRLFQCIASHCTT